MARPKKRLSGAFTGDVKVVGARCYVEIVLISDDPLMNGRRADPYIARDAIPDLIRRLVHAHAHGTDPVTGPDPKLYSDADLAELARLLPDDAD
jgi:hypothetical protein